VIRKTVLLLLVSALATGCWNRRELNDLAIVVGIGIDKIGNQYEVTIQVVSPAEVSSRKGTGNRAPVTTYFGKGDTVFETIRRMSTVTPRKLYFAHVRMLVLGEEIAKEGLADLVDFISRDHELRTDFYFAVAKGTPAREILSFYTPLEKIPANKMYSSIEVSEKIWAPTISITLDELISSMLAEGKNPVLTGIRIQGDEQKGKTKGNVEKIASPAKLEYDGVAVFKFDKLVGWMNEDESKGYSNITNKLQSTIIEVACPKEGKLAIEVVRSKTTMRGSVTNGKPEIKLKTRTEANVGDVECKIDLSESATIQLLEKEAEEVMKRNTRLALAKAKKLESDIFGFGEALHRSNPGYYKKVEKDWSRHFVDLPVHLDIDVKIRRLGTVFEPVQNKMRE